VLSASVLLLLVACANVGNLLLAHSLSREREFVVRRVLGATPGGMLRQVAAETGILIVAGSVLGAVMAFWF
jgi:ABC-type antimicrobial peptide transport system permease subunit